MGLPLRQGLVAGADPAVHGTAKPSRPDSLSRFLRRQQPGQSAKQLDAKRSGHGDPSGSVALSALSERRQPCEGANLQLRRINRACLPRGRAVRRLLRSGQQWLGRLGLYGLVVLRIHHRFLTNPRLFQPDRRQGELCHDHRWAFQHHLARRNHRRPARLDSGRLRLLWLVPRPGCQHALLDDCADQPGHALEPLRLHGFVRLQVEAFRRHQFCLCRRLDSLPQTADRPQDLPASRLSPRRQYSRRLLTNWSDPSRGCMRSLDNFRPTNVLATGFVVCALSALCGCGPSRSSVSGVVTLDGNPLPNARVILTPVGGSGRPAHATTDESGKFTVTSVKPGDGAYRGEYKVTFSLIEDDAIDLTRMTADPNEDAGKRAAAALDKARQAKEKKAGRRNSLLHANYTRIDTTPFTLKVPTSGDF